MKVRRFAATPRRRTYAWLLAGVAICTLGRAYGQEAPSTPLNLFGSPGMVDMPSARMAPDGQLTISTSFTHNTQHYNLGFQALPWLETTFRYSGLQHFDPLFPVYYDRSFAAKIRLWQESDWLPAVAVGINDAVGTGIYAGEFVAASKQVGPLDFTLGMGWGRMGTADTIYNPLRQLSSKFARERGYDTPGAANLTTLFHGPNAGIFGGVNWQTPLTGLTLSAEYSSDAYVVEAQRNTFVPHSQINYGATYELQDGVFVSLNWLYGTSIGGNFSFALNPIHDPFKQRIGPALPPVAVRSEEEQRLALERLNKRRVSDARADQKKLVDALWSLPLAIDGVAMKGRTLTISLGSGDPQLACAAVQRVALDTHLDMTGIMVTRGHASARCAVNQPLLQNANGADDAETPHLMLATDVTGAKPALTQAQAILRMRKNLATQKISVEALAISHGQLVLHYANFVYFHERDALDRITRVLMQDAPPDVEVFHLIPTINGVAQREFDILRAPLERSYEQTGDLDILAEPNSNKPGPTSTPVLNAELSKLYPNFGYSIFPQFRQQLFDPSNPLAVQFLAGASAQVEITKGLTLQAEGEVDLYDNFNTLRPADSLLPHVRTDFVKFFSKGKNGIGNLELDYRFRVTPTVVAMVRTGYLESMYAGFGGEALWRPENQRWALGVDAYEVKERAFDRLFGLQPYHVFTGHVSLYYASPWYGLNFALRAGQYLAADRGLTFEATRRFFDTGVEIGAFFTKTNVSAQNFGEGSFDKGIIIRIPLGWVGPLNTQDQFAMDLRPVQRDGGQRLQNDALLYDETRNTSQAEMLQVPDN